MASILNWYVEEGIIFKGGSGAGVNLSKIRSSYEPLAGGGTASGPVSFMRGADASAGTIKSGGTTRRAAKMVILNVDHPDIQEFIWCKQREELKARALGAAGFDMDLDGRDFASIQYQNANNSVRVTDEFMQAVLADKDFALRSVISGGTVKTLRARDLMREISQAAWECADPGMQYDTTINEWHTSPNAGRINGSNPCCFSGEVLVETAVGPIRFDVLEKMAAAGEPLPDGRAYDHRHDAPVYRSIQHVWIAGTTDTLIHVATARGLELRCTPEHRFLTGQGYVPASELAVGAALLAVDAASGVSEIDTVTTVDQVRLDTPAPVYDLEVRELHNFVVASDRPTVAHGVVVHNSEYMHLDNSACNLASLNLRKFEAHGVFDVEAFCHAVEIMFTAQEIIVENSGYPTDRIAANAREYRQLGLGYANLGGLLMSQGLAYDSEEGRAWASAITALMTGHAYRTSAEIARVHGPFEGYARDRDGMLRVLRKHRAALDSVDGSLAPRNVLSAARQAWDDAVDLAGEHGVRNAQASVLAPTGCLVGDSLVATDRGLVRLASLGDPSGARWQDVDVQVATDEGPRPASRFYVNGSESVVSVETSRGYRIQGTPTHRIKVVTSGGRWEWKRFADLARGDVVPLLLDQLVGEPQRVSLPMLGEGYAAAPLRMTADLAEFLGVFMASGSLHCGGIRLLVEGAEFDAVDYLARLGKTLFGLEAQVSERGGHAEIAFDSVLLAEWWMACGFAPAPCLPDAVLATNDRAVYAAFLRGLFPAAVGATTGEPRCSTTSPRFSQDVQCLLLALGYPTSRRMEEAASQCPRVVLRLLDAVRIEDTPPTHNPEPRFFYDTIAAARLGDDELTYDLSVPVNVTYIANGFISHNTIGLMMDCDTTGIEPDLGLVKSKKLVGGGTMRIVNQTVPAALARLGYQPEQIEAIVAYIDEYATIEGAPAFRNEHLPVFDCAMGERSISPMGHVKMMAAVQPWISGAISKCVSADTLVTTGDGLIRIGSLHQGEPADSFRDEIIEVASLDGPAKTDAFYYGGLRKVRTVTLRSGHTVTGTENHRVLVASDEGGFVWRHLGELEPGERVATQYGSNMWSVVPARFDDFEPVRLQGGQEAVRIPAEMTSALAFLLGAYAAQGRTTEQAVVITSSVDAVLERTAAAWRSEFCLEPVIEQAETGSHVRIESQAVVDFLDYLEGDRQHWENRIPDAVLRSPREMVLAYVQGFTLQTDRTQAICIDSSALLNDLQAVLTNLGVVHTRISEHEISVHKHIGDVVSGTRLRFSPVVSVTDDGQREVFDLSVPTTHAFVGNGIVNHNTVNLPESATVEDVERVYIEGWKRGLKALAIYRDNCKVAQPLSLASKKEKPATTEQAAAKAGMVRRRLPKQRPSQTISFQVGEAEGYLTAGEYPGDGLGEIFVKLGKQGSTLSGVMDAFAISVSIGLQYGVPLEVYVRKFTNMRFEPAGMTDDPEVRFATSIVDYLFRRLAIEYLPAAKRQELGIYTIDERGALEVGGSWRSSGLPADAIGQTVPPIERPTPVDDTHGAAPMCYQCGVTMIRAGSCHCCPQCGTTSGCS
ncbi:MAG: hypothetical protein ACRD0K_26325 [Egibacteraceae bacterium]